MGDRGRRVMVVDGVWGGRACGVKSEKSPKMRKILAKNRRKCAKFAKMCKFTQKCAFLVNFTLFRRIFAHFSVKMHIFS